MNLLILVSIMKVVVTKLRLQSSLSTQQLQIHKAVRATLILFPLLGITNLLFFINPKSLQRREHEFLYMLVNSVLKSSQVEKLSSLHFKHATYEFSWTLIMRNNSFRTAKNVITGKPTKIVITSKLWIMILSKDYKIPIKKYDQFIKCLLINSWKGWNAH